MTDLLITGGTVADGTGAPARTADVAISAERVAAVGDLADRPAARSLDASGCIVSPGFVDVHTHSDPTLLSNPAAHSNAEPGSGLAPGGDRPDPGRPGRGRRDGP
jgi:N-acyl-D-amino-acid deacylase